MNPQYEILAKCLLPTHMLECFELTNVEVKPKEKTATQDTESDESPVNIIHLYLDENELRPDNRKDLRPNGFTPAKTFPQVRSIPSCPTRRLMGERDASWPL